MMSIVEKLRSVFESKQLIWNEKFDYQLFKKLPAKHIENIVCSNFVHNSMDLVRNRISVVYPDPVGLDSPYSIEPEKVEFQVKIYIFSEHEISELIAQIKQVLESNEKD